MVLEQRLPFGQLAVLQLDIGSDRRQLRIERVDIRVQLGQAVNDDRDLVAYLDQQPGNVVVLSGDIGQFGSGDVQRGIELVRRALEVGELLLLGSQRRLELSLACLGFSDRIGGKDRAAIGGGDDARPGRQQGNQRDGEEGASPHPAMFRPICTCRASVRAHQEMLLAPFPATKATRVLQGYGPDASCADGPMGPSAPPDHRGGGPLERRPSAMPAIAAPAMSAQVRGFSGRPATGTATPDGTIAGCAIPPARAAAVAAASRAWTSSSIALARATSAPSSTTTLAK